jgi:hypothetical protein
VKAIAANRHGRLEVPVALDGEAKCPACGFQLADPYRAKLRAADAEITKTEGDIGVVREYFGQKPSGCAVRCKELHNGVEVEVVAPCRNLFRILAPVLGELLDLGFGKYTASTSKPESSRGL